MTLCQNPYSNSVPVIPMWWKLQKAANFLSVTIVIKNWKCNYPNIKLRLVLVYYFRLLYGN